MSTFTNKNKIGEWCVMVLGNVILAGAVVVTLGVLTIMLKVDEVKRNSRRIIGDATK